MLQEMADCLRDRPAIELMSLTLPMEIMSQPCVDGDFSLPGEAFLAQDPRLLMEAGEYSTEVSTHCTIYLSSGGPLAWL